MGCSNGYVYININPNILIKLCLNLYKNEIIINNSIQESLYADFKYKPKEYCLVNRFWKEDFLEFFSYNEFKSIIIELIGKEYNDVNIEQINAFSKGENLQSLLKDERIKEKIEIIRKKINIYFPKELKAVSHIKNNFIKLNEEKETFPDYNSTLMDKETFDLMIKLLDGTDEDKNIKKAELNKIFCSKALLGNENIYIEIKKNEILICFLENESLRTKYFIYFKNENNFEDIIKKYILDRTLEMHIEYNYDISNISEHEMSDGHNDIGFFVNFIPINTRDEINQKLENQGAPPITYYASKNSDINNINMEENNKRNEDIMEDKNINNIDNESINNNKEKSLIEENSENDLINKKDDSINNNNDNISFNKSNNLIGNNDTKKSNNDNVSINLINNENNEKFDNLSITDNGQNDNKILIEDNNLENSNNKILRRIKKMESKDFINEILQCLINIEIIRDFFIGNKNKIIDENKKNANFCKRFFHTIKYVNNYALNNDEKIFDDDFLKKNNFNSNFDIVSFLSFLFNKFKDELKDLSVNINEKCIDKFFYGQRNIECTCQNCGKDFNNRQPFFYLKFDLSKIFQYYISQNDYIMNINLLDCFNYNFQFSEEFVCDKCGSKNYKIKIYEISSLPDIIIIILENGFQAPFINKFKFESTALVNDKEKTCYSLVSQISQNERETLVTNLKSLEDLKWRECIENDIVECSEVDVKNKVPYVLFYQRIQDLNNIKLIDEDDNSVILHENDNIDLIFYSTVTRIKERLEHLDSNYTIGYIYNEILCKKYKLENKNRILFFSNSRKLDGYKSIKDNNLNNDDFVIIVEYNYSY